MLLVTGFQVAISILGRGRLEDYVECLENTLQAKSMVKIDLENSSLPVSEIFVHAPSTLPMSKLN